MQSSRQIRDCLPTAVEVAGAKARHIPWDSLRTTGLRNWPLSPFSGRDMEEATKALE